MEPTFRKSSTSWNPLLSPLIYALCSTRRRSNPPRLISRRSAVISTPWKPLSAFFHTMEASFRKTSTPWKSVLPFFHSNGSMFPTPWSFPFSPPHGQSRLVYNTPVFPNIGSQFRRFFQGLETCFESFSKPWKYVWKRYNIINRRCWSIFCAFYLIHPWEKAHPNNTTPAATPMPQPISTHSSQRDTLHPFISDISNFSPVVRCHIHKATGT